MGHNIPPFQRIHDVIVVLLPWKRPVKKNLLTTGATAVDTGVETGMDYVILARHTLDWRTEVAAAICKVAFCYLDLVSASAFWVYNTAWNQSGIHKVQPYAW